MEGEHFGDGPFELHGMFFDEYANSDRVGVMAEVATKQVVRFHPYTTRLF